jgi:riboflavin synthase
MFTGIIEEVGTIASPGARLKVRCRRTLRDATEGSSIAVNGVCLTATSLESDGFWADLAPETLARTNLGDLLVDSEVNLERPVAVGDRLSGHIVQGHVDGTATLVSLQPLGDGNWWLTVRVPPDLSRYMIQKGSVTLDGISLTIAAIQDHLVSTAIIPHTYEHTALRRLAPGARVNVEVDLIAKYVEKLMVRP